MNSRIRSWAGVAACLIAAVPGPALALQPLSEFLAGVRSSSIDARVALETMVQQQSEALVSLGHALPSFTARGVYTRNQFESKIDLSQFGIPSPGGGAAAPPLVIQPYNQLDAYFEIDAPIVDFAAWNRARAARANEGAARRNAEATVLDVEKQVALNYYQLVGAEALRESAQRTLEAAQQNLALTQERHTGGVATELDIDRAAAEVERSRQNISDAELTAELSRQALRTLTGLSPEGPATNPSTDDLHEEAPLSAWLSDGVEKIPSVAATIDQRQTAEATALASNYTLIPSLTASAQEHLTNATGFVGHSNIWNVTGTVSWKIDVSSFASTRSQSAAAEIARLREEGARRAAFDQVREAWFRVHNGITKSRASRAESQSASAAVARARERYQQGAGTQFELVQAERDAFTAQVSRIQADADLSHARVVLRLAAGQPLDQEMNR